MGFSDVSTRKHEQLGVPWLPPNSNLSPHSPFCVFRAFLRRTIPEFRLHPPAFLVSGGPPSRIGTHFFLARGPSLPETKDDMRVITGSAGGLHLKVPKSGVRPTTDRTKAALFSWIGDAIRGASVLDLFSGTGALGIEALSRGAREAVFVEAHPAALKALRENLALTKVPGATVRPASVESVLSSSPPPQGFDFVFADPPWAEKGADKDWVRWILSEPRLPEWLAPGGWFVLEAPSGKALEGGGLWQQVDRRRYGTTTLWFWKPSAGEGGT